MTDRDLSDAELERYARHVILDEIGVDGQLRMRDATAMVIGAGGLGCPASMYLATSGIGRIVVVDDDTVELANLQRQFLYSDKDIGSPKASQLAARLAGLNPHIQTEHIVARATADNLADIIGSARIVLDCTDNFATRHAINAACHKARKDLVTGAAERFDGQICVFSFASRPSPCYGCLFPRGGGDPAPTPCSLLGVVAPATGVIGSLMAHEAIRLVAYPSGKGLQARMLACDFLDQRYRRIEIQADPDCPVCGS